MPASRRTPPTRRPRVAGLRSRSSSTADRDRPTAAPVAGRNGDTSTPGTGTGTATTPTDTAAAPDTDTAAAPTDTAAAPETGGSRRPGRRGPRGPRGPRGLVATLVALVAVFLVTAALAVWFRGEADALRSRADTNNTALLDAQATSQVKSGISTALETVYSYDYRTLDADEAAARKVITGEFTQDYNALFAEVRELAPPQQVEVDATVVDSAVKVLDGDRAVLVVFLNQQGTRGTTGEQFLAPARLRVTAQQMDGRWKIAAVENL